MDYTFEISITVTRDDATCHKETITIPSYVLDLNPIAEDTLKQKIADIAWEMFVNAKSVLK